MSVNIKYKNNSIAELSDTGTKTLKTAGKYCEADIIVENTKDGITPSGNKAITATTSTQTGIDVTNYATVSVAPTPSETKSVTTNGDVTPSSGKLLSKVTVNVPTGTARDSSDLTVSGATVNVPAGLYSSAASKSVASGTAGTPTASKGAVSNNSVTVTPSVENTEGYITGGTKTGAGVKVSASELVSGNKAITPSETAQSGIDVTNFKTASVGAISSTYVGSGVTRKAAATVAPSTSEQTVCASGVYTTGEQKVSAITPSIVGNLDASSFAASIVVAVEGKGVTVPAGTLLDGMAALIESIEAGGGGMKVEVFSLTPAQEIPKGKYEIGETTITNPHFCVCFDGTQPDSKNTDTKRYNGLISYVGCDATLWGNIGSAYDPSNFGLLYKKKATEYGYERYNYGNFIRFNKEYDNSFYVTNGKLYSNSSGNKASAWLFEAGHTYYILLIGE